MRERIVIAIDGLAGSGKTSIARLLATRLHFTHLPTGMLYRAVGLLSLREGVDIENEKEVFSLLKEQQLTFVHGAAQETTVEIGDELLGEELNEPRVSDATSRISRYASVRSLLLPIQREAFPGEGLVAEGRDIQTIVFPDAEIKFFIEASVEVRVERRIAQLGKGLDLSPTQHNLLKKEMEKEIFERDLRDSERALAPTMAAKDAICIDTSQQTLTQVIDNMYAATASRGLVRG